MKKYLLVLFGNFNSDKITKEIALNITPLVDSAHLKFQRTNGALIFHFASEVSQDEIYDYIWGTLVDLTNNFILTEFTDKSSVCFPQEVLEHLLDLENTSEDVYIDIRSNSSLRNEGDEEDEDDFVALLLDEVKNKIKRPSLDYLLDKINSNGYESLTEFEKDTLESYSKN